MLARRSTYFYVTGLTIFSTAGSALWILYFRFYNEGCMSSIYRADGSLSLIGRPMALPLLDLRMKIMLETQVQEAWRVLRIQSELVDGTDRL